MDMDFTNLIHVNLYYTAPGGPLVVIVGPRAPSRAHNEPGPRLIATGGRGTVIRSGLKADHRWAEVFVWPTAGSQYWK